MKKIFTAISSYQYSVMLEDPVSIDENYVHVDTSETYHKEEMGWVKKLPEKIMRNIKEPYITTDGRKSFAEIVGTERPTKTGNLGICRKHIKAGTTLVGDEDTSLTYAAEWSRDTLRRHSTSLNQWTSYATG